MIPAHEILENTKVIYSDRKHQGRIIREGDRELFGELEILHIFDHCGEDKSCVCQNSPKCTLKMGAFDHM